jgi:UPF0288 family protein (methanogenesis marker protein 3)
MIIYNTFGETGTNFDATSIFQQVAHGRRGIAELHDPDDVYDSATRNAATLVKRRMRHNRNP